MKTDMQNLNENIILMNKTKNVYLYITNKLC